jgi:hypothetical protein
MVAGWPTVTYLVHSLSRGEIGVVVNMPDFVGSQLLLGLLLGGALLGIILAMLSADWARQFTMAVAGALGFLIGLTLLAGQFLSEHLPPGYPMRYPQVAAVVWAELVIISVLMQRRADRSGKRAAETKETS